MKNLIIISFISLFLGCAPFGVSYNGEMTPEEEAYMIKLRDNNIPLMITSIGTLPPNSAGGVAVKMRTQITSPKIIKYIHVTMSAYNEVRDKVSCDIRGGDEFIGKITGPLVFGDKSPLYHATIWNWSTAYYNWSLHCVKLTKIKIEYMDGGLSIYGGEDLEKLYAPERFRFPNIEWAKKYDPDFKSQLWECPW